MWPLLACSVLAVAVCIERLFAFWKLRCNFDTFRKQLTRSYPQADGQPATTSNHPFAVLAAGWFRHRQAPIETRATVTGRIASEELIQYETRVSWLSIIARVAPLLGLLGTIAGLVSAFYQIELQAGQVSPGDLASGIWSALLTTVFGLSIALPALIAHQYLYTKVGLIELQMQWLVASLEELRAGEIAAVDSGQTPQVDSTPPHSDTGASA